MGRLPMQQIVFNVIHLNFESKRLFQWTKVDMHSFIYRSRTQGTFRIGQTGIGITLRTSIIFWEM